MIDFSLEQLIIASVITLWLANGWYLNQKLKEPPLLAKVSSWWWWHQTVSFPVK